ncbi:hypothetical protein KL920_000673 [Ogataea angusta]|nr:hypothetical protein KL920_000673 [Ogataea angusta]
MYGLSPNKSPEKRDSEEPGADVKRQKHAATPEAPDETLTPKSSPMDADKHARQRLKKQQEEERRLRREQEALERKMRKEREENEKRARREKLEAERLARKEQKEREKLERQQKREAEARAREAKRQQEEEEKARRRAEQEERALKKAEAELEKLRAKELEQQKLQKQSITNFFKPKDTKSPTSSQPTPEKAANSDYHTYFLPFNVRPGVRMAQRTPQQSAELDKFLQGQQTSSAPFRDSLVSKRSPRLYAKASDVIQAYNLGMVKEAQEQLDRVPKKYLRFYENAKPPYLGTYSFLVTSLDFRLALDPFTKIPPDILQINYDFDSDLEEEDDDDEGEDVELDEDSEEDEDGQLDESSDIEQFVETDENGVSTKKTVIGPLVPVVSWIGQEADGQDQFAQYFSGLQYERLRHNIELPIDPMCDYWGEEEAQEPQSAIKIIEDTRTSAGAVESGPMTVKKKIITDAAHVAKLASFIAENSDFSINTMTEIAQKQILADYSKAVVKNSIKELATFDKKTNKWAVKQSV